MIDPRMSFFYGEKAPEDKRPLDRTRELPP
jgi:hypothetical protein